MVCVCGYIYIYIYIYIYVCVRICLGSDVVYVVVCSLFVVVCDTERVWRVFCVHVLCVCVRVCVCMHAEEVPQPAQMRLIVLNDELHSLFPQLRVQHHTLVLVHLLPTPPQVREHNMHTHTHAHTHTHSSRSRTNANTRCCIQHTHTTHTHNTNTDTPTHPHTHTHTPLTPQHTHHNTPTTHRWS